MNTQTTIATPAPEASAAPSVMAKNPKLVITEFEMWGEQWTRTWAVEGFFDAEGVLSYRHPTNHRAYQMLVPPKERQLYRELDAAGLDWPEDPLAAGLTSFPALVCESRREPAPPDSDSPKSGRTLSPCPESEIPRIYRRVPLPKMGMDGSRS